MGIQKFSLLQLVAKLDVATLEHLESLNLLEKGKWGKLPSMFQLNGKLVDVVLFQISWQNRTLDWNFPFPKNNAKMNMVCALLPTCAIKCAASSAVFVFVSLTSNGLWTRDPLLHSHKCAVREKGSLNSYHTKKKQSGIKHV